MLQWLKLIKKEFYLVIVGGMLASALGGATLATILHKNTTPLQHSTSNRRPTRSSLSPTDEPVAEKTTKPPEDEFVRKQIILKDEVEPRSDFDYFREELRRAVRDRNAYFVRSILPEDGISLGFSSPIPLEDIGLENPAQRFWSLLEKAIATSCAGEPSDNYPNVDPGTTVWVCSNVTKEFYRQYPPPSSAPGIEWELNHVVIVGKAINMRSAPSIDSSIVTRLSNEVVKVDRKIAEKEWQEQVEQGKEIDPVDGWTPIIIPNGEKGYVYNYYVYSPLEYRAIFGQVAGEWELISMPGGN